MTARTRSPGETSEVVDADFYASSNDPIGSRRALGTLSFGEPLALFVSSSPVTAPMTPSTIKTPSTHAAILRFRLLVAGRFSIAASIGAGGAGAGVGVGAGACA